MVSAKSETVAPVMAVGDARKSEVLSVPQQIENLIREYFPECPDVAVAIAKAESNLELGRVGDKHLAWNDGRNGMSCGLFQVRVFPDRPDCEELQNAEFNIQYARKIYDKSGWSPWSTFKSKRYLKFI